MTIGPFTIRSYGFMIFLGIIAALLLGNHRAKKKGLGDEIAYDLTFVCAFCGMLGAKLLYLIMDWKEFWQDPVWGILYGFVVYGGIIGGILAAYIFSRKQKYDFRLILDLAFPSVAVAQGFGRIGCFLAGCCYGAPTDAWYGITFHNSYIAPNDIKLFPTQLVSSAGMFCIAGILLVYDRYGKKQGRIGALYLFLYSIGRFCIEFWRGDAERGHVGVLSTSQFISIFIFIFGVIVWMWSNKEQTNELKKVDVKEGENTAEQTE